MPVVDFQIGGANRARQSVVPTAVPSGLSDLVAGAGDFAEVFAQKAIEDQLHRDNLTATKLRGRAKREIAERTVNLDPTADDHLQRVEEVTNEVQADIMSEPGISNREVLESLELDLTKLNQHTLIGAVATRHEAIEDETLTTIDEEANEVEALIRSDPDGSEPYAMDLARTVQRLSSGLRPDVAQAKARELQDRMVRAKVVGLAEAERYDDAKAVIKENAGDLTADQARTLNRLIREIQDVNEREFLADTDRQVADLEVEIDAASNVTQLAAARGKLEAMDELGRFKHREQTRVRLLRKLEGGHTRNVKADKDLREAQAQYASNLGFFGQAPADLYYEEVLAPQIQDLPPEERQAALDNFIERGRVVPTPIKQVIANSAIGDNVEQLASSAEMSAHFQHLVPGIDDGSNIRTSMVQSLMAAGHDPQTAARLVIDNAPDEATAKRRTEEYKAIVEGEGFDPREFLIEQSVLPPTNPLARTVGMALNPFATMSLGIGEPSPDQIPEALALEASRVREENYRLFGDMGQADKATTLHLRRTWGTTRVGGEPRLQKRPPERHLHLENTTPEQRAEFLTSVARRLVEATGEAVPEREDGPAIVLETTNQTLRDLQTGEQPRYEVRVWQGTGDLMVPVPFTPKGGTRQNLTLRVPDPDTAQGFPEFREIVKQATKRKERFEAIGEALGSVLPRADTTPIEGFPVGGA